MDRSAEVRGSDPNTKPRLGSPKSELTAGDETSGRIECHRRLINTRAMRADRRASGHGGASHRCSITGNIDRRIHFNAALYSLHTRLNSRTEITVQHVSDTDTVPRSRSVMVERPGSSSQMIGCTWAYDAVIGQLWSFRVRGQWLKVGKHTHTTW